VAVPRMASGRRVPSARPTIVAPIRRSGSAMRPIGRRRSDASPVISVQNGWPASTPESRRAVVPELPQSMTSAGSLSPRNPVPANGRGTIETYTVVHKREGPFMAIVVGHVYFGIIRVNWPQFVSMFTGRLRGSSFNLSHDAARWQPRDE